MKQIYIPTHVSVDLKHIEAALFILDKDWHFIFTNPQVRSLLGVKIKEIQAKDIWSLFKQLRGTDFYKYSYQVFKEQKGVVFEDNHLLPGRWILVRIYPSEGNLAFFLTDITRRKENELRREEIATTLNTIFDTAPIGFAFFDTKLQCQWMNRSFADLIGFKGNLDCLGSSASINLQLESSLQAELKTVLKTRRPLVNHEHEAVLLKIPPRKVYWLVDIYPIFNSEGKTTGIGLLMFDITERKRIEENLREKEQQIRLLLQSTDEGLYGLDLSGNCIFINKSAQKILGYAPKEVIGKNFHSMIHHHDKVGSKYLWSKCPIYKTIKTGVGNISENEVLWNKNGKSFPAEYSSFPIIENGISQGVVVTFRDISQRKFAEAEREQLIQELDQERLHAEDLALALKRERDILNAIKENTKTHLAYLDSDFNFIQVNSAYIKGCGFRKKDLIGKNHFDLFPNKQNQAIFKKVKESGEPVEFKAKPFKYRYQPEKGITYWDWTLNPITNAARKTLGFVFSCLDVTDNIRIHNKLKESEQKFKRLFNSNIIGVFITDSKGNVFDANDVFLKMIGYNRSDLKKGVISWNKLTPKEFKDIGTKKLKEIIDTGEVLPFEKEYIRKDESRVPILIGGTLMNKKKQTIIRFAIDITESKELEKRKDEFISMASHELKTPITTLKIFGQLLDKYFQTKNDPKAVSYITKMSTQLDRIVNLIDELLDVTRITSGKIQLFNEVFPIDALVDSVVEDMQAVTKTQVLSKHGSVTATVLADKNRIAQVLVNLLTNAIKYSPVQTRITIKTSIDKDAIVISVQDSGIGISGENQKHIFERFYRVNGKEKKTISGLGLGLYISKQIIELNKGKIWLTSQKGKGSKFYISLPLYSKVNPKSSAVTPLIVTEEPAL